METPQMRRAPRVISLLPAAAEYVGLLGAEDCLVGRGHGDDFPPIVTRCPVVTAARHPFTSSSEVDAKVTQTMAAGEGMYELLKDSIVELAPTVIITQGLCSVCAVDEGLVFRLAAEMNPPPTVVSLSPANLDDIIADVSRVGAALGLEKEAAAAQASLQRRVDAALALVKPLEPGAQRPVVAFMEWTDPIYCGGHWTPQIIQLAGGEHPLNPAPGKGGASESFRVSPEAVAAVNPYWIIVCPCGLDIATTKKELREVETRDWWRNLTAVQQGRVVLVDGNQMFNRSGPRVVDALEWLVGLLNNVPDVIPPTFPWEQWAPQTPGEEAACLKKENDSAKADDSTEAAAGDSEDEVIGGVWAPVVAEIEVEEAHRAACQQGTAMYTDPRTGYMAFTELSLRERGTCCGNRCRHCPYGHFNLPEWRGPRLNPLTAATFISTDRINKAAKEALSGLGTVSPSLCLLHWMGGIGSYLALKALQGSLPLPVVPPPRTLHAARSRIILLSCFDPATGRLVAPSSTSGDAIDVLPVSVRAVMDQALHLHLSLLAVPVSLQGGQEALVTACVDSLRLLPGQVAELVLDTCSGRTGTADESSSWRLLQEKCSSLWQPLIGQPQSALLQVLWVRQLAGELHAKINLPVAGEAAKRRWVPFTEEAVAKLPPETDVFSGSGQVATYVAFELAGAAED